MNCGMEPFVQISSQSSCAESPPCSHIFCWSDFNCLIASTLSPIITGCRRDGEDIFCICPPRRRAFFRKMATSNSGNGSTTTSAESVFRVSTSTILAVRGDDASDASGLSGGAIAGIIIACVVGAVLLMIVGVFVFRYVKDRRKNHGEYRPQFEEQHHAKDLPYLQPPNIEGLI